MKLSNQAKDQIIEAIKRDFVNYPNKSKHAMALGINAGVYGDITKGDYERKLSDAAFISIARRLGVSLRNEMPWRAAETAVFVYITEQLEMCQRSSLSGLLCDVPNIGKTFSAKAYVKTHPNAIYVDCGQVKTKMRMVRFIAKEFGLNGNGRYADVYDDLVYYLKSIDRSSSWTKPGT